MDPFLSSDDVLTDQTSKDDDIFLNVTWQLFQQADFCLPVLSQCPELCDIVVEYLMLTIMKVDFLFLFNLNGSAETRWRWNHVQGRNYQQFNHKLNL
jgi:hypothetical protein